MTEKYVAPMPAIGMTVQFFAQAMTNETPQAALVLAKSNERSVDLMIFPKRGSVRTKIAVPHVSDPRLEQIDTEYRTLHGGWDFVPIVAEAEQVQLDESGSAESILDPPRRGPGRPRKHPVAASSD